MRRLRTYRGYDILRSGSDFFIRKRGELDHVAVPFSSIHSAQRAIDRRVASKEPVHEVSEVRPSGEGRAF